MKTGQDVIQPGLYASECCGEEDELDKDASLPRCLKSKELREILQERISDNIVTAHREDNLPNIKESDTVIITSEEKNTGILYRRLLNKLEEQIHRGELLSDLIRLFSSSIQIDELLDRVVS